MDWSLIWKAGLALASLAFLFGILLAFAAEKFAVETDERVEEILDALVGSNCGACGYPGCHPAAEAVAAGKAGPDVCIAGGPDVAKNVAAIMGIDLSDTERGVALVFCKGGLEESPLRADYRGIDSCAAADKILGGGKACNWGCLGLGTCRDACPVNAITIDENRNRTVNRERCTGCGLCLEVCPRGLIQLVPRSQEVLVVCNNRAKGASAKEVCSVCCIACKKCEKVCDFDAIHVEDNRAWIDYDKCTQCGKCIDECPTDVILRVVPRKQVKR